MSGPPLDDHRPPGITRGFLTTADAGVNQSYDHKVIGTSISVAPAAETPAAARSTAPPAAARALAAPAVPPEGDLHANGTGWLLGVGDEGARVYPWMSRLGRGLCGLAAIGPAWVALFDLTPNLFNSVAMGAAPVLLFFNAARLRFGWNLRRAVDDSVELRRSLARTPAGTRLRVRGRVVDQPTVTTLFLAQPAVMFRNRMGGVDETRGLDFIIELEDGQRARVSARGAVLLDRPRRIRQPPACGPVSVDQLATGGTPRLQRDLDPPPSSWDRAFPPRLFESSISPGDEVEIIGVLHHEPAPDGVSTPGRQTPMRHVLRASPHLPLCVRKA